MNNIIQIKRRLTGETGAPFSLSGGELAFNEVDKVLYYGANNGGPGNSIGIAGSGLFVDRTTDQTVGGIKTFTNTVSALGDVEVDGNVDANSFSINSVNVINSSREGTFTNIDASGNVTVGGNLTVLGDTTTLETTTYQTSSFNITNAGSETALVVNQTGTTDIAHFQDDGSTALIVKGSVEAPGYVGINTSQPNERLTVVGNISATGTLNLNSAATLDSSLSVGSTLTVTGATTLNNTLDTIGNATFAGTLSALGATDLDSTLDVVGATTLQSTLNVTGSTQLDNGTIFTDGTGNLTLTGNLTGTQNSSVIENFIIDCGSF